VLITRASQSQISDLRSQIPDLRLSEISDGVVLFGVYGFGDEAGGDWTVAFSMALT
jgi:hypothetical protein